MVLVGVSVVDVGVRSLPQPTGLLVLDAFQYVILLVCFHDFAFVNYSTKSLQDQYRQAGP